MTNEGHFSLPSPLSPVEGSPFSFPVNLNQPRPPCHHCHISLSSTPSSSSPPPPPPSSLYKGPLRLSSFRCPPVAFLTQLLREHRSETTSHYFLDCFLYQQERAILFNKISEYLPRFQALSKSKKLEIILSGFNLQNIEPDQRNVPVVFAVQNYILKTKRFSTPPQPSPPPTHHAPTS